MSIFWRRKKKSCFKQVVNYNLRSCRCHSTSGCVEMRTGSWFLVFCRREQCIGAMLGLTCKLLNRALEEWDIISKDPAIVTDNASNMTIAVQLAGMLQYLCIYALVYISVTSPTQSAVSSLCTLFSCFQHKYNEKRTFWIILFWINLSAELSI